MYVILVYDMEQARLPKMLKLCRRYLNWVQNSVFEGELTEVQLRQLKWEAGRLMDPEKDSLLLFTSREPRWMEKEVLGLEKGKTDQFL